MGMRERNIAVKFLRVPSVEEQEVEIVERKVWGILTVFAMVLRRR